MDVKAGKKTFLIVFAIAVFAITVFAVAGENGLIDVIRLKKERDRILSQNREVERESERLRREIELLKADKRYIAEIARRELGMIGKNEIIYKIERTEDRERD